MKAYNPRYKTENRALCCICGHLRTISYKRTFRYDDPAATRRRTTDSPVGTGE
ncbi:hypothetical protein MTOK_42470 [Mycolicibacterium tokaiense]|nr:hypothetical protein MTOK_42470 [Mycolicibacterium tokaiense]